jgi:tetratricopeptide (TPR) repeat protein
VLEYAALLPADQVVLPWLRALAGRTFPALMEEPLPGYPDPWRRVVRRLAGLRLLVGGDAANLARMHRLLQEVVVERLGEDAEPRRREVTEHALARARSLRDGWVDWSNRWELSPLAQYALARMTAGDLQGADLAGWVAMPFRELGQLVEARDLIQRALAVEEKAYAADHPTLAISYSNLALVERDLGNLAEARRLLQRAIAIDEKAYAADHPTLAVSYSNLALVERDLGNLAEARRLLQRAIAINEKAYAADHPTLAISYSNLALVERDLGNLAEARRLLQQALAIEEKAYAADHPTLAIRYSNLALVERDLGNLPEARALMRKAHAIWQARFGEDQRTRWAQRWLADHEH